MKDSKWLGMALSALLLTAPSFAGEVQFGLRLGQGRVGIDGDRMESGESRSAGMLTSGFTLGYRATGGLVIEAGTSWSIDLGIGSITDIAHSWLGAGWQFDRDNWRITPKIGVVHTAITASGEDLIDDGERTNAFSDTVPFAEASFERRFGSHFGLGLFVRQNFEDFGFSRSIGLQVGWTFN